MDEGFVDQVFSLDFIYNPELSDEILVVYFNTKKVFLYSYS